MVAIGPAAPGDITGPPSGARAGAIVGAELTVGGLVVIGNLPGLGAGLILAPIGAAVGAVVGALAGSDPKEFAPQLAALRAVLSDFDVTLALAKGIVDAGRPGRPPLVLLTPDRAPPAEKPVDTLLEVSIERVALEPRVFWAATAGELRAAEAARIRGIRNILSTEKDPNLTLGLTVKTRLVRQADATVLFERVLEHPGQTWRFTEWTAEDAKRFRELLDEACRALGAWIVDELL